MDQVDLSAERLRTEVDLILDSFLADQSAVLSGISDDLAPFMAWMTRMMAGGKRLRPAFCVWGFVAAGGEDLPTCLRAAAALELLQAGALIHDDVMDRSDVRRGMVSAHRSFAALHVDRAWAGDPARFGEGAAILLGDLALCWADELFLTSGFDPARLITARPIFDIMRTEVMSGQILDLVAQADGRSDTARAMQVLRFKSAKYSVERPLHLGACLAGAEAGLLSALSEYGLPLGEAFQLRDDVLGVFGDPELTGKPAGDDLREGKQTVLLAIARRSADDEQRRRMDEWVGRADLGEGDVAELRAVIEATGAREEVEAVINDRTRHALEALDGLTMRGVPEPARLGLSELVLAATQRRH